MLSSPVQFPKQLQASQIQMAPNEDPSAQERARGNKQREKGDRERREREKEETVR